MIVDAGSFELVNAVNDPNFQLMIDFYHLASEREDPAIVLTAREHLRHLHMANPQGRVFPLAWDEYDYAPFFASLRRIGYDKRISIEASAGSRNSTLTGPSSRCRLVAKWLLRRYHVRARYSSR